MTDLGDPYSLTATITNASGVPENAGSVHVVITLPDGNSVDSGAIASTSPGVYNYSYPTVQVGRHNARWEATGTNASAFSTGFYVNPSDTGEFISLTHFRSYIKKKVTTDDETIRTFIAATCSTINDRCGQISPITLTEDHETSFGGFVRLRKYPIISVTSVLQLPGLTAVPQGNRATGVIGWYFDSATNAFLPLNIGRCGWFRITYRAGRLEIPQNYILGALELTRHLWQTSQQNPGGGRPPIGTDDVIVNGVSYAMPYNVRQLLGLDKRPRLGIHVG